MEIATTRTYYFTADEMRIIYAFCKIADDIAIYNTQNYSAENFFCEKYKEYVNTGKCSSAFRVSD